MIFVKWHLLLQAAAFSPVYAHLKMTSPEFVLTHEDISLRNLILDQHEQVWLIDWAYSGAYPPSFESAALLTQSSFTDFNETVLSLIPRYSKEELQLDAISYGLTTAALACEGARTSSSTTIA
jgi:thiamine kinase-like enzyme